MMRQDQVGPHSPARRFAVRIRRGRVVHPSGRERDLAFQRLCPPALDEQSRIVTAFQRCQLCLRLGRSPGASPPACPTDSGGARDRAVDVPPAARQKCCAARWSSALPRANAPRSTANNEDSRRNEPWSASVPIDFCLSAAGVDDAFGFPVPADPREDKGVHCGGWQVVGDRFVVPSHHGPRPCAARAGVGKTGIHGERT